jgi:DNA modification methylase
VKRYDDGFASMFVGDAIDVLSQMPEKSVHCCVTSPPYFGLRAYLPAGHPDKAREGGAQETPDEYVEWLVGVFRSVWKVLRDDGTLWLNLGDSYAGSWGAQSRGDDYPSSTLQGGSMLSARQIEAHPKGTRTGSLKNTPGLKGKDLMMIPARVALALQADGWYLRSQIVWAKPNPMPESVTDRPTQATEMVYLLSKKPRYFYDSEAVKEKLAGPLHTPGNKYDPKQHEGPMDRNGHSQWETRMDKVWGSPSGRNLRNYWQISTRPYPGSHYATFPPELPMRCIKAGTSERGVCDLCGAPFKRRIERTSEPANGHKGSYFDRGKTGGRGGGERTQPGGRFESRTVGWEPACLCFRACVPATVLDPFSGSGTTLLVARKLGRKSIGIDLDERNLKLLEERMGYQSVLL